MTAPDDFDENTPPPRQPPAPKQAPPRYVKLAKPTETAGSVAAAWEEEGRIAPGWVAVPLAAALSAEHRTRHKVADVVLFNFAPWLILAAEPARFTTTAEKGVSRG